MSECKHSPDKVCDKCEPPFPVTAPDPRLDEIQARLSAATPGPWFQGREGKRYEDTRDVYTEREVSATSRDIGRIDYPEDAALIANAPADVAFLLAELRKAHEALARVEALHKPSAGHNPDCHCGIPAGDGATCLECGELWPCETRAAVAAAKGDGQEKPRNYIPAPKVPGWGELKTNGDGS